jgi:hypothetical protein
MQKRSDVPKVVAMNQRQWELYRLSVVETWAESPYKTAVSAAIEHKLMILEQPTNAGVDPTLTPAFGRFQGKGWEGRNFQHG